MLLADLSTIIVVSYHSTANLPLDGSTSRIQSPGVEKLLTTSQKSLDSVPCITSVRARSLISEAFTENMAMVEN